MDIVVIKIPRVLSDAAVARIEDVYTQKLKDGGCTNFVVIVLPSGADVSVIKA